MDNIMKKETITVMTFWLSVVAIAFWWNLTDERMENERLAFETARAFFHQIVITRMWNADHGGVYVPVTGETQPNPFIDDPLRDLTTENGLKLTKINPAYMTRQIAEIAARSEGIKFRLISLDPVRPENIPDPQEKLWLQSFEEGALEKGDFFATGPESHFRYMAPLFVQDSCLQCHAKQGYEKGDVRGGISISIPYLYREKNTVLLTGYGLTALAGFMLILIGGRKLERERALLLHTNRSLEHEIEEREKLIRDLQEANSQIKTLSGIVPICMYCKEIRDDRGYWSRLEKFISEHSTAQFSHCICPKCMKEKHPNVEYED